MSTPTTARWSRLDEALLLSAPAVARSLAPPAASGDLAQLAAAPWCSRAVRESYAAHDGAHKPGGVLSLLPAVKGAPWSAACRWMPIAEALEERDRVRSYFHRESAGWWPIARVGRFRFSDPYEAEDQYVLVIDADSEDILAVTYHEYGGAVGSAAPLSIGWPSYLDRLTERLESGSLQAGTDAYGVLRLEEMPGGAAAARARRAAHRDAASSLIAALAERGLLLLRAEPTPELLHQVRRALGKRSPAAQAAALMTLFSELDEVDEIFAGEDDLAAFLEQF